MPAPGDHDARRRDVSVAVWSVLAARGFGGLTLRAVATEMGASTGLLTHYFPTKRALLRHALGDHIQAAQRTGRLPAAADPGELAATAAAFAHGLVVQALFAPGEFPPDLQARLLDTFLSALGALPPD